MPPDLNPTKSSCTGGICLVRDDCLLGNGPKTIRKDIVMILFEYGSLIKSGSPGTEKCYPYKAHAVVQRRRRMLRRTSRVTAKEISEADDLVVDTLSREGVISGSYHPSAWAESQLVWHLRQKRLHTSRTQGLSWD